MKVGELIRLLQNQGWKLVRTKMMRYMVVLEHGDKSWGAYVPDLPGCIAAGETRDEVVGLIRDAVATHIETLRKDGLPVPKPSSEGAFVEIEAS